MLWSAVNFGSSTAILCCRKTNTSGTIPTMEYIIESWYDFRLPKGQGALYSHGSIIAVFSCFWPQNSAMSILFVWEFEAQFWSFQLPPPWPLIKRLKAELNQIVIHMEYIIPRGGIYSCSIDEVIGWCAVSLDALSWDRHTKRCSPDREDQD